MSDIGWASVSAIAAAIAAATSLLAVVLTALDRRRTENSEVFSAKVAVFAKLLLLDRSLDNALRRPNKQTVGKTRKYLYELLRTIGDTGGNDPAFMSLCELVEQTSMFIDELDFTHFKRDVVTQSLSDYELRFRTIKNKIESDLNGKRS
jgi:hypothetical protein